MTTVATGQQAETAAAKYLQRAGYEILERNWRTKVCEIDIIARKDDCLHFIEVKYRAHDSQGSGLEYITKPKIRQMKFAAEYYMKQRSWRGDSNLAGIEVGGPNYERFDLIESISCDY